MCGITGIFHFNDHPVSSVILKKMTNALAHRGPDGEGIWVDKHIGLGHRRLAIIDLTETGKQPMHAHDHRYTITYNGEIYNYKELRKELESEGLQFYSQSDTEVILYSFAKWREKCLDKFNGMFAFAIWDRHKKELFLARDRYGIKPLYIFRKNQTLLFGSEIKAILKHPDYTTELDKEALIEYFTFQNLFTNKTLFKDINILEAGHYLKINTSQTQNTLPIQYWDFHFHESEEKISEREWEEELDRLFTQSVKRQLVSDVEVGAYLSGGIDSGSITAIASQDISNMKTFTCGFDLNSVSGMELMFDEREKAEYMSYLFKTSHYQMVLKAGDMENCLSRVAFHIEEPRVGQSYPNYYAAHLASKFVKVVLAGTGGDELFGGYPWRYYRAVINDDFDHYTDKYYKFWQRLMTHSEIKEAFSPIWKDVSDISAREIFSSVFKVRNNNLLNPKDYVNHSMYFEAKTFLHGLLTVEDKLSMAHGVETRVPFLDNDLVDFAQSIPVNLKLGNLSNIIRLNENDPGPKTKKYFQKTKDGKILLRKVMEKHIPQEVSNRIKQGFSAPDASWFKGESMEYIRKLLTKDSPIYDHLNRETIKQMVNEHLDGKVNRRLLIWSLLNFDEWCNNFLEN